MTPLTQILVPLVAAVILFGTGLTISAAALTQTVRRPPPLLLGIACQLALAPLLAVAVGKSLGLNAALTTGLAVIAMCPGNVSSPLLTRLARGDVALSLAITAATTFLCPFTLPFSLSLLGGTTTNSAAAFTLPLGRTVAVLLLVTIIPTLAGLLTRRCASTAAARMERRFPLWGSAALLLLIAAVAASEWTRIRQSLAVTGLAVAAFNLAATAAGLALAALFRLHRPQLLTITLAGGLRNCAVAALVTLTLMRDAQLALPAFAYAVYLWLPALLIARLGRSVQPPALAPQSAPA